MFKKRASWLVFFAVIVVVAAFSIPPAPVKAVVKSGFSPAPTPGAVCSTCPSLSEYYIILGSCLSELGCEQAGQECHILYQYCTYRKNPTTGATCSDCYLAGMAHRYRCNCDTLPRESDQLSGTQNFCVPCGSTTPPTPVPGVKTGGFWIEGQAPGAWFEVGSLDFKDIWLRPQANSAGVVDVDFLEIGSVVAIRRIPDGAFAVVTIVPGRQEVFLSK